MPLATMSFAISSDTCGNDYRISATEDQQPAYITTGPDGNLWFTESLSDLIGTITPTGQISERQVGGMSSPEGAFTALYC